MDSGNLLYLWQRLLPFFLVLFMVTLIFYIVYQSFLDTCLLGFMFYLQADTILYEKAGYQIVFSVFS